MAGDAIEIEGVVTKCLPGSRFLVTVETGGNKHEFNAYISGKMRKNNIRILEGDSVRVELSQYDLTQGRIVFRDKKKKSPSAEADQSEQSTS